MHLTFLIQNTLFHKQNIIYHFYLTIMKLCRGQICCCIDHICGCLMCLYWFYYACACVSVLAICFALLHLICCKNGKFNFCLAVHKPVLNV